MPSTPDAERHSVFRDFDSVSHSTDPTERGHDSQPVSLHSIALPEPGLLKSFWIAGFEGSDHVNAYGRTLAMNTLTQHHQQAADDYQRAASFGMRSARESVGWRLSERGGRFDFTHLESRARAAAAGEVQVIWTLLHYGWPQDLHVLDEEFVPRFARYAGACARYLKRYGKTVPVYAPIHEISYLAWAVCESGMMQPERQSLRGRVQEVKRQLVRAALAACDAIWKVDPRARILHTDPLIHIVAAQPDQAAQAILQREQQFEAWDMLSGRTAPELGGHPRYLDVVGLNYFPANQWESGSGATLAWHMRDPRRADLADLLAEVHQRYQRPLLIAETGHAGIGRGAWIREVAEQVRGALKRGIPVEGVCLYAVVDRPDWNNPSQWHGSGLWDLETGVDGTLERRLNSSYAADLRIAQQGLDEQLRTMDALRRVALPARSTSSEISARRDGLRLAYSRGQNGRMAPPA
jgi:beta-glucosidase/6-phospho-beta-glucosidase/beta-galactosidase